MMTRLFGIHGVYIEVVSSIDTDFRNGGPHDLINWTNANLQGLVCLNWTKGPFKV